MKSNICLFTAFMLCLGLLTGCGIQQTYRDATVLAVTVETAQAAVLETTPLETVATEVTAQEHSEWYISGLEVEDVILYFNEVCLDAEYYTEGDPSLLQKWGSPIYYTVQGSPTEEDLRILSEFVQWLNGIEGFPGMKEVQQIHESNLQIYFCDEGEMKRRMGNSFVNMDGAVTFWYDGNNVIHDAIICYRTDLAQELRSSVILEEIYNGLGPVQDSQLRHDSIISADFTQPEVLTEIDELILKLLYHPDMLCGMTAIECETVIRRLYW